MNLDRITPHMAHELAMLAVQKSHEGLAGAAVAKIYRDAFTNCDKEPDVTGQGQSMASSGAQLLDGLSKAAGLGEYHAP